MNKLLRLAPYVLVVLVLVVVAALLISQPQPAECTDCKHEHAECTINESDKPCCPGLACIPFNPESENGKCEWLYTATPTVTKTATVTKTLEPTSTNTPEPTATNTKEPTATNTPEFTPTSTPKFTATPTMEFTPTVTPTGWIVTPTPVKYECPRKACPAEQVEGSGADTCGWSTSYTQFPSLRTIFLYVVTDKLDCDVEPDYQSLFGEYVYNLSYAENEACNQSLPACLDQSVQYSCSITAGKWLVRDDNTMACQPGVWSYNMREFAELELPADIVKAFVRIWYDACKQGNLTPLLYPGD